MVLMSKRILSKFNLVFKVGKEKVVYQTFNFTCYLSHHVIDKDAWDFIIELQILKQKIMFRLNNGAVLER